MGITKQYLRWVPSGTFGTIGSSAGGIQIIKEWPEVMAKYRIVATAACESVAFWDIKTNELITKVEPKDDNCKSSPISCIAYSEESNVLATGHGDGTVRLLDCATQELKIVFAGHKGFVSCLAFDRSGLRLASGGNDTEIIVWDVTNNSGLFRLRGHKGPVNKVQFLESRSDILVSASNDTFIKFWNMETQHCFKTLAEHRSEVWSFALFRNDTRMISGGSEAELKVWKIYFHDDNEEEFTIKAEELRAKHAQKVLTLGGDLHDDECEIEDEIDNILIAEEFGSIIRKSSQKVENILLDPKERLILCHGKDDFFECFKVRNEDEIKQKIKNRLKKERKRAEKNDSDVVISSNEDSTLSDEIEKMDCVRTISKCRAIHVQTVQGKDHQRDVRIAILLANNALEFFQYRHTPTAFDLESNTQLINYGHRADVRCVAISQDSLNILTASSDCVKLWSKATLRCKMTISDDNEYPLCASFMLGGKFAVIGTKTGNLQILNTVEGTVSETIKASETGKPVWSMCLLPDSKGIVTGSEDKTLKFWNYEVQDVDVAEVDSENHSLTLVQDREMICDEGVIAVKVSPNGKFVAAATLDSTVKIHFCDTLKFFLSLYGHKFPVLCMDISSDNQLIVTGSSDKNIKIWGMDFGDCHRSLFAHDDNIMSLAFFFRIHQFFTVGKDAKLKFWDADAGEKVAVLDAHHAEIWTATVAPNGKYLVTAGHDRTIRVWNKTNEPLILSEEKEAENEKNFADVFGDGGLPEVPGVSQEESAFPERKTIETVKGAENLIEAIDIFEEELEKLNAWKKALKAWEDLPKGERQGSNAPARESVNPNLLFYRTDCPYRFVLEVLLRIKSNELEKVVLELPFAYTTKLLHIIEFLFQKGWEVEMLSRITSFVVRVHFGQICASPDLFEMIGRLRSDMKRTLNEIDELVGVNCFAMKHFMEQFHSKDDVNTFGDLLPPSSSGKHKKRYQKTAAVLTMN